eukprot:6173628-Pleurochrysis_carterae.AAC.4
MHASWMQDADSKRRVHGRKLLSACDAQSCQNPYRKVFTLVGRRQVLIDHRTFGCSIGFTGYLRNRQATLLRHAHRYSLSLCASLAGPASIHSHRCTGYPTVRLLGGYPSTPLAAGPESRRARDLRRPVPAASFTPAGDTG